jgi:DNA-binding transcriptional ArsR family regulator
VFAALGHDTRLRLVSRLCSGRELSITELSRGTIVTRQAVTKHLALLEIAGVIRRVKRGRQRVFSFSPGQVNEARKFLEVVSSQWDAALGRLKAFAERTP